jgi:hypothetical protein
MHITQYLPVIFLKTIEVPSHRMNHLYHSDGGIIGVAVGHGKLDRCVCRDSTGVMNYAPTGDAINGGVGAAAVK